MRWKKRKSYIHVLHVLTIQIDFQFSVISAVLGPHIHPAPDQDVVDVERDVTVRTDHQQAVLLDGQAEERTRADVQQDFSRDLNLGRGVCILKKNPPILMSFTGVLNFDRGVWILKMT